MIIQLTKSIPNEICIQISKFFNIGLYNGNYLAIKKNGTTLKDLLVRAKIIDQSQCLFDETIRYSPTLSTICVADKVLAVILKIDVQDSMDIEFIFKSDDTQILFKDALYWKSFYFHNEKTLHDCGQIYYDIEPDIISYMVYGKYVHEGIDGPLDESLIELYMKGEQNFKNLLILKDMVKI